MVRLTVLSMLSPAKVVFVTPARMAAGAAVAAGAVVAMGKGRSIRLLTMAKVAPVAVVVVILVAKVAFSMSLK